MGAMPKDRYLFGILPWYSVLIVIGVLVGLILCSREEKRRGLPQDTVIDLALWAVPAAIVGARTYFVIFSWDLFRFDPLSILRIWEGGLAIYGGIIGGLVAILLFSRIRRIPVTTLTDLVVPALALGQAIGRWGNYFNMEAYGVAVTDPRWQFFPAAVLIPESGGDVWHMATFFYESVWDLGIFLLLWFVLRTRVKRPGIMTLTYLTLYGLGRMLIEGLRTDSLMSGSLRVSQVLSLGLFILGLVLLCVQAVAHRKTKEREESPCQPHQ